MLDRTDTKQMLTTIKIYTPTSKSYDEEIKEICNMREEITECIPRNIKLIFLCEWNTPIAKRNK